MIKTFKAFILIAVCFVLTASFTRAQVQIIVLDGTNIVDYRILNTNFARLNTGIYDLVIGKVTNSPSTNGPWGRMSNEWVTIVLTNFVEKTGDDMSGELGVPTATGSLTPSNDNQFVRLSDARKLIQQTTAFWLTTNASGISNYYWATNILSGNGSVSTNDIDAGEYPFAWVVQSNGVVSVPIGQVRVDIKGKRTAPGGPVTLIPELYVRHADGSEPEWCETGEAIVFETTIKDFIVSLGVNSPTNLIEGDLALLKLKSTVGSGGDVTIYVGTNAFSSVRIPTTLGATGPPGPAGMQSPLTNNLNAAGHSITGATEVATETLSLPNSGPGLSPVGSVIQYVSSNAPTGWLLCTGQGAHTVTYSNLHTVIGYQYGGSGTNFLLPDLRGRVPVGLSASGSFANLNATGGVTNVTLSIAQMPAHNHDQSGFAITTPGEYAIPGGATLTWSTVTTGSRGSTLPHDNMPPYIVLNYIIKY